MKCSHIPGTVHLRDTVISCSINSRLQESHLEKTTQISELSSLCHTADFYIKCELLRNPGKIQLKGRKVWLTRSPDTKFNVSQNRVWKQLASLLNVNRSTRRFSESHPVSLSLYTSHDFILTLEIQSTIRLPPSTLHIPCVFCCIASFVINRMMVYELFGCGGSKNIQVLFRSVKTIGGFFSFFFSHELQ